MKAFLTTFLVLAALGASADIAHGQIRAEADGPRVPFPVAEGPWFPIEAGASATPIASSSADGRGFHDRMQDAVPYSRVLAGTTIGAVAGGAAGLALAATLRGEPADGDMFPWAGLVAATVLGSLPGMYAGARWGSGGRGSAWQTGAAALGGTALGVLTGAAIGAALAQGDTGKAPEVLGIAVGIAVPLALTSWTEWRTQP